MQHEKSFITSGPETPSGALLMFFFLVFPPSHLMTGADNMAQILPNQQATSVQHLPNVVQNP